MARLKTANLPDLRALADPQGRLFQVLERAVLRGAPRVGKPASIAERVAVRLAGAIVMDEIHAGQRLLETDISEVLRVSRAPVREALRILERDRLIRFLPSRGAVVTTPDADDLRDLYAVRMSLYAALLTRVMEASPERLRSAFDRVMPELSRAARQSLDDYVLTVFLLNDEIFDTCESPLLVDLLKSISLRVLRYTRLGLLASPDRVTASLRGWRELHRAVGGANLQAILAAASRRMIDARDSAIRALD